MLGLKASNKSHWISFAIAHHLNGSHQLAAHALKTYEDMQVALLPLFHYMLDVPQRDHRLICDNRVTVLALALKRNTALVLCLLV